MRKKPECFGQHADNRVGLITHGHGFPDDVRLTAEMLLPEAIAQNHGGRSPDVIVRSGKAAANQENWDTRRTYSGSRARSPKGSSTGPAADRATGSGARRSPR